MELAEAPPAEAAHLALPSGGAGREQPRQPRSVSQSLAAAPAAELARVHGQRGDSRHVVLLRHAVCD